VGVSEGASAHFNGFKNTIEDASHIFLRDTFYQNDLAIRNTVDEAGGTPIAV
jgi:hypothetical protein